MSVAEVAATERRSPRWSRSAWVRLPILFVVLLLVDLVFSAINGLADHNPVSGLLVGLVLAGLGVVGYRLLVRWLEGRRPPAELARAGAVSGLARGFGLGLLLFATTLGVIALFGGYRVTGFGSVGGAVTSLGLMCSVAVTEELAFRGALFRLVEEKAGTWGAMAVSGVAFGGLHLVNPDATVWGGLAIAIEAGLLFGATYAATRSLWLAIGMHLSWNFAEGGIFGTVVSGNGEGAGSLLKAMMSGPDVLTGGQFGPEASIVAIVVCGVPTVLMLLLAGRRGRLLRRGGVSRAR